MSIAPVPGAAPSAERQPVEADRWRVEPGETLVGIARALQQQGMPGSIGGLVRELARLNRLADPDRIEVGQLLQLPARAPAAEGVWTDRMEPASRGSSPPPAPLRAEERRALLEGALLRLRAGRAASDLARATALPTGQGAGELRRAPDGTPLFRQGDPAWRAERLGVDAEGPTLAHAGCAVTACAMALSRMGGQVLTPVALLRHLREHGGFQGALVDWGRAATAVGAGARAVPGELDLATADCELDAGRPVLLRVLHDVQGVPRQHWICVTGRDARTGRYTANDPATGRTTTLIAGEEGLSTVGGEPVRYVSNARMVTFAVTTPPPPR